ncbi:uncharacterized protein LOC135189138 [Pogoniulus pusillus]|uniref:uncharacterized protein LOC135189138 n=1 Tax=Pogoniulus pusillus TaxID=488313 RepID=UPI0030B95C2F
MEHFSVVLGSVVTQTLAEFENYEKRIQALEKDLLAEKAKCQSIWESMLAQTKSLTAALTARMKERLVTPADTTSSVSVSEFEWSDSRESGRKAENAPRGSSGKRSSPQPGTKDSARDSENSSAHASARQKASKPRRKRRSRPDFPVASGEESSGEEGAAVQRHVLPVIRTESVKGRRGAAGTSVIKKQFTDAQLSDLQVKYARDPGDSVADYVYRVSRAGGDRVLLDSQEAAGDWGDDVFLTREPEGTHSLTARIAYWASSVRPAYRGEPTELKVTSSSELITALRRLACVQAIYDKGHYDCPFYAPVDPERLHPIMKGLPATLQIQLMKNVEKIERVLGENAENDGAKEHVMTWAELLTDLNAHGLQFGFGSPEGKGAGERQSRASPPENPRTLRRQVRPVQDCPPRGTGPAGFSPRKRGRDPQSDWRPRGKNSWYLQALTLGVPKTVLRQLADWQLKDLVRCLQKSAAKPRGSREKPSGGSQSGSPRSGSPPAGNCSSSPDRKVNPFSSPTREAKH